MKKIGVIDYFFDEAHASVFPDCIKKASDGNYVVAYGYAAVETPREDGVTNAAWCEKNGVELCASIEEVVEKSDVLVVLAPDFPAEKEELCRLPLASGKPCYVDKTLAPDRETAERIFRYADEHHTPTWSSSGLSFAPTLKELDIDHDTILGISAWGPAWGGGIGYEIYAIHQIDPIMTLIDAEPTEVMIDTAKGKWYTMIIHFDDGRAASVSGFVEGMSPFMLNLSLTGGNKVLNISSGYNDVFYREMVEFFEDKQPKIPHSVTCRTIAAVEAGLRALETPGKWVPVK